MYLVTCMTLACVLVPAGPAPARAGADVPEIRARHWFNNPVYRLHDNREVILFFFTSARREQAEASARIAAKLNRLAQRPDVVVIGLTPDSRLRARRFLERHRVRFTIGANSRSHRDFGIRRLPALVRIEPARHSTATLLPVAQLDALLPPPEPKEQGTAAVDTGAEVPAEQIEELRRRVADAGAPPGVRKAAVRELADLLAPEEFVALAEERLALEEDPWVRGALRFYRDLANGTERYEYIPSPSTRCEREYNRDPQAPEWRAVRQFSARLETMSADELYQAYLAHPTDSPTDLLIRRLATIEMFRCTGADRPAARKALLQIVATEQDAGIRMYAAMSLSEVCSVGDDEAAGELEALAEVEPDLLMVRPMLEYVGQYLRTGLE